MLPPGQGGNQVEHRSQVKTILRRYERARLQVVPFFIKAERVDHEPYAGTYRSLPWD